MHRFGFTALAVGLVGSAITMSSASAQPRPEMAELLPANIRQKGVVRIGSQQTFAAIEFKQPESGRVAGVSAELLTEMTKRLGLLSRPDHRVGAG